MKFKCIGLTLRILLTLNFFELHFLLFLQHNSLELECLNVMEQVYVGT